jgi:YceI-like protein
MFRLTQVQLVLVLLLCGVGAPSLSWSQARPIDVQHSVVTFKSGLFSAFADNHEIRAPISSGFFDEAGRQAELVIDSRRLVALDPGLAPEKRQQVQQRMLGPEVLDSDRFREIRFEASKVEQIRQDHFLVSGSLSLHGRKRPISVQVLRSNGRYRGDAVLKQRDFGITPVSVAGGTVKVKDELKIEFDIVAGQHPIKQRAEVRPDGENQSCDRNDCCSNLDPGWHALRKRVPANVCHS